MRRTLTRRLSRGLLSGGLLQLLLRILLATSLSLPTTLSSSAPFPITALLLIVVLLLLLELGCVLPPFNHTEFICSLLVMLAIASPGVCLPGSSHRLNNVLKGQIWVCFLLEGEELDNCFHR